MAERTIKKTARLTGHVRVPGELRTAARDLWMAAISDGQSRFTHLPPAAQPTLDLLAGLGVGIDSGDDGVTLSGVGLRGLSQPQGVLDLDLPEEAGLTALAILSQQGFVTRARIAPEWQTSAKQLVQLLARGGASGAEENEFLFRLDGADGPGGVAHEESDLPGPVKLGLLTAGLYADGPTVLREPPSSKDRVDALWKARGVQVEGSRQADPTVRTITLTPNGGPKGLDVDVAGDLERALPFVVAALSIRRADVTIQRVVVRPENRALLDIARQIGAEMEIVDGADGSVDLHVKGSARLKPTRVADKRAQSLLSHAALVAVLGTQTEGEFILRDVESLREGAWDFVEHLADLLRAVEAKIGEYSYGLVIEGGRPLKGARIETRGHAGLAQAFGVAGLIAAGEMEIEASECVDPVFPGFYEQLESLTSTKPKETTT